ncbi:MAG: bifunctional phosphopantothenoylcysteine decarboxylase/phosphopantothenate--cysteine ligase CoaBC [Clostridia bacterium]|nr:bifunctional phosphopantothenoylcysteine decarboxylase/phosphopantothenate--cysteine ligase CoaBC [Clostridia bacterium]
MLEGKCVVVGVCGGIAAYKAVDVVSRLKKHKAEVHVIMTESAVKFVAPLTFQSISGNPVTSDMFSEPKKWNVEHISLARKADIMVIAPATANILGKVCAGIADDMLSTTIMATNAPVLFVPAMNHAMYENAIVQQNISKLGSLGYLFMEPDTGLMAAEGEYGKGRLPEPQAIVERILREVGRAKDMEGKRVLVTAGPTREPIDPVRFISNHSSGKMGYAIAEAAIKRGARVDLITGPVSIPKPQLANVINVNTAEEMHKAVFERYQQQDVLIMVAAVADYRCKNIEGRKIKKAGESLTLELVKNPDIAADLGKVKGDRILVGFGAETHDLEKNAVLKLNSKNMDIIAANDVTQDGAGFGTDTNIVKLFKRDGSVVELPKMSKREVAESILNEIVKILSEKK